METYNIFKDYFIAIAICCGFFLLLTLAIYIRFNSFKDFKFIFKKISFVFKWWLIGKTHCDTNETTKRFYKVLHKIFWGFVLISVALTLATISELLYI